MTEKKSGGGGLWIVAIGLIGSAIGIYAFARDEITAYLSPTKASAKIEDVERVTTKSVQELSFVIEENSLSEEDIKRIVSDLYVSLSASAAADGRVLNPQQTVEFIDTATELLETTDEASSGVREALVNSQPREAASLLVRLAETRSSSPDSPKSDASDAWRKAGAIIYPISPREASQAYQNASRLNVDDSRLASLAKSIEAELKQRDAQQAPDAVQRLDGYTGPVQMFETPIEKGGITLSPKACEQGGLTLICAFDVTFEGEQRRVDIRDITLIDDWSRRFFPSLSELANRSDDDNSVFADLIGGNHSLSLKFESVPGGSNYGLQMTVNGNDYFWRGVPTGELDTSLREEWGGPVGVAAFIPLNETLSFEPYALRSTGCERFGRDIRCFGQVAYAGPLQRLNMAGVKLTDSKGREYQAAHSSLAFSNDDDSSVYADLKTGNYDYYFRFFDVPLTESYTLSGVLNNNTNFAFTPFKFAGDDEGIERVSYFYDFPLRLNEGGNVRYQDLKLYPKGCKRVEYDATCDIEFLYVGEPRQLNFDRTFLVDNLGNYYPAVWSEIVDTRIRDDDNSLFGNFTAGKYTLRHKYESLPPARLFEQKVRINQSADLLVSNLTLPNAEGRMGLPTDITYTEVNHSRKFGDIEVTTHGCIRRGSTADCLLEFAYFGPPARLTLDEIKLLAGNAEILADSSSISGAFDTDASVNATLSFGRYQGIFSFSGLSEKTRYRLSFRLDRQHQYQWDTAAAFE